MELNQARESRDWLKAAKKRLEKELSTKNEWIKTQEEVYIHVYYSLLQNTSIQFSCTCIYTSVDTQAIAKHSASRQFLETKVEELEKVREASNQEMDEKSVLSTFV